MGAVVGIPGWHARGQVFNASAGLGESCCEVPVLVPVVVLFALYPSLFTLSRLAR
jgi:hypothetical protein